MAGCISGWAWLYITSQVRQVGELGHFDLQLCVCELYCWICVDFICRLEPYRMNHALRCGWQGGD